MPQQQATPSAQRRVYALADHGVENPQFDRIRIGEMQKSVNDWFGALGRAIQVRESWGSHVMPQERQESLVHELAGEILGVSSDSYPETTLRVLSTVIRETSSDLLTRYVSIFTVDLMASIVALIPTNSQMNASHLHSRLVEVNANYDLSPPTAFLHFLHIILVRAARLTEPSPTYREVATLDNVLSNFDPQGNQSQPAARSATLSRSGSVRRSGRSQGSSTLHSPAVASPSAGNLSSSASSAPSRGSPTALLSPIQNSGYFTPPSRGRPTTIDEENEATPSTRTRRRVNRQQAEDQAASSLEGVNAEGSFSNADIFQIQAKYRRISASYGSALAHMRTLSNDAYWEQEFQSLGEGFTAALPPDHRCELRAYLIPTVPQKILSMCQICYEDRGSFLTSPASLTTYGVIDHQTITDRRELAQILEFAHLVGPAGHSSTGVDTASREQRIDPTASQSIASGSQPVASGSGQDPATLDPESQLALPRLRRSFLHRITITVLAQLAADICQTLLHGLFPPPTTAQSVHEGPTDTVQQ